MVTCGQIGYEYSGNAEWNRERYRDFRHGSRYLTEFDDSASLEIERCVQGGGRGGDKRLHPQPILQRPGPPARDQVWPNERVVVVLG